RDGDPAERAGASRDAPPGTDGGGAGRPPATDGGSTGSGGGGSGAKYNLIASPDNAACNYIPNGALGGGDLFSVDFYFLIIGGNPSDVPGGLSVPGSSGPDPPATYPTPHH